MTTKDHHISEKLVRPNDIDGSLAIIGSENWAVTLRHIENNPSRGLKRTTLMWDGTDWDDPEIGIEPRRIRRRAVVGPWVENTPGSPFCCMVLYKVKLDDMKTDEAIWGRPVNQPSVQYEEASRNAALDAALHFCSYGFGDEPATSPPVRSESPTDPQRQGNFHSVNQVVVLAFNASNASRLRDRVQGLFAMHTNLAEAFLPSSVHSDPRTLNVDDAPNSEHLAELRSMIGDIPIVTAQAQKDSVGALNALFKQSGLNPVNGLPRSVDITEAQTANLEQTVGKILSAARERKRIDSGWHPSHVRSDAQYAQTESE